MAEQVQPKKREQLVLQAAPSNKPDLILTRLGAAYDYLTAAGWRQCGINEKGQELWTDPKGSGKAELKLAIVLPGKEDQPGTPIKQLYMPPVAWDYPTDLAVQLQRERDRGGENLESIIAAKKRELADLEAQLVRNKEAADSKKAG